MAVRQLLRMGHPLLRQKALPLLPEEITSAETQQLIGDMNDTMQANEGVGLAAPQIGVSKQIALVGTPRHNPRYPDAPDVDGQSFEILIAINPQVTVLDSTPFGLWEGCLSVPGLRGYVERPRQIRVEFFDEKGKKKALEAEDFTSTVFQHEIDHLYGFLYIDRVEDTSKISFLEEYQEFHAP